MKTKLFEIRDRGTFMPVMTTQVRSSDEKEIYLLRSSGFSNSNAGGFTPLIILHFLELNEAHYDAYHWEDRTRHYVHNYIQQNWDALKSGDVIDVEYILGETTEPKMSQRQEEIGGYCLDTF